MKSKHAELFTAKLNDMDLVLFEKHRGWGKWALAGDSDRYFMVSNNFEYFLCLSQHKEAVLCGLNGGSFQVRGFGDFSDDWYLDSNEWSCDNIWYMLDSHTSRVKPKKEKRLIVYRNDVVYGPYLSIDDINTDFVLTGQVVEIEVEV